MKTTIKTIIVTTLTAAIAAYLLGCASAGSNFDENRVSQIKKSETTEADLVQMFGAPQQRNVSSEGQTVLTWMYTQSNVKGESFIPIAGAFMGGANTKHKMLSVVLHDGVVQSFSSSGGGMDSRSMTQDVPK